MTTVAAGSKKCLLLELVEDIWFTVFNSWLKAFELKKLNTVLLTCCQQRLCVHFINQILCSHQLVLNDNTSTEQFSGGDYRYKKYRLLMWIDVNKLKARDIKLNSTHIPPDLLINKASAKQHQQWIVNLLKRSSEWVERLSCVGGLWWLSDESDVLDDRCDAVDEDGINMSIRHTFCNLNKLTFGGSCQVIQTLLRNCHNLTYLEISCDDGDHHLMFSDGLRLPSAEFINYLTKQNIKLTTFKITNNSIWFNYVFDIDVARCLISNNRTVNVVELSLRYSDQYTLEAIQMLVVRGDKLKLTINGSDMSHDIIRYNCSSSHEVRSIVILAIHVPQFCLARYSWAWCYDIASWVTDYTMISIGLADEDLTDCDMSAGEFSSLIIVLRQCTSLKSLQLNIITTKHQRNQLFNACAALTEVYSTKRRIWRRGEEFAFCAICCVQNTSCECYV